MSIPNVSHTSGEALNASYDAPLKKLISVSFSVWKESPSSASKHVAGHTYGTRSQRRVVVI